MRTEHNHNIVNNCPATLARIIFVHREIINVDALRPPKSSRLENYREIFNEGALENIYKSTAIGHTIPIQNQKAKSVQSRTLKDYHIKSQFLRGEQ